MTTFPFPFPFSPPRSLRGRLLLAGGLWVSLGVTLAYLLLSWAIADTLNRAFQDRLTGLLDGLAAAVEPGPGPHTPIQLARDPADPRFDQIYSGWYWQISLGETTLRSRSLWDSLLATEDAPEGLIHARRDIDPGGLPLEVVERDIRAPGLEGVVHLTMAADRSEVEEDIFRLRLLVALCLTALGGGLLAAALAQVTYGLRPLGALGRALERLRDDPETRVDTNQPEEIAPLARALNALLDHDAALIERARTHVGNLAHGLKTPLAVLNALAETGAAVPSDRLRAETSVMARLVDRHLARARAETTATEALAARAPILETAERLRRAISALGGDTAPAIRLDIPPDAQFPGDVDDLMEILGNLMDNAGKWASTVVLVSTRGAVGDRAEGLVLSVEDDGPGLAEDAHETALARGARLDDDKPGHGLGLDIVSDLVSLRGGTVALDRSPLGGLRVILTFP